MAFSSRRTRSLRAKFSLLDKNCDDKLSFDEVKESLRRKYMGSGMDELKASFNHADKNDDGYLNFHEFLELLYSKADGKCIASCENAQFKEAPSDTDEKEDGVHQVMCNVTPSDGENFDHWLYRAEDYGRRSPIGIPLIGTHKHDGSESHSARWKGDGRTSLPHVLPPLTSRSLSARRASDRPSSTQHSRGRRQSRGPENLFYERSKNTWLQTQRVPVPPKAPNLGKPTFRRRHEDLVMTAGTLY